MMGHVLMINFPGKGTSILLSASQRSCKGEGKASYIMQLRNTLKKLKKQAQKSVYTRISERFYHPGRKRKDGLCRSGLQYVK